MASHAISDDTAGSGAITPDMAPAQPTSDRIVSLDFVRGAALFGILLMNITGFGLPHAYGNPVNYGGAEGANLMAWLIIQIGFEGTQRGLFSMLFGAGVILFTSRLEAKGRTDVADIYMRRNLWLAAFGMVNGYIFLWSGDILYFYGLIALILYPFRRMAARYLLLIGAGAMLIGAVFSLKEANEALSDYRAWQTVEAGGPGVTKELTEQAKNWEKALEQHEYTDEEQSEYIAKSTASYASAFWLNAPETMTMESTVFYRFFFLDIFGMMMIGMGLFKLGVFTLERSTGFYLSLVVVGYGVGLTTNYLETQTIMSGEFSLLAFKQSSITYDLGRLATTAGHLGLLLLIARSGVFRLFQHALASVGRMAFTNYLTHSVVCAIFFVGFGYYAELQRYELYYVVLAICLVQLVVSPIWLSRYRMGPLEWLWRALTYMKVPPLKKAPGSAPEPA